MEQKKPQGNVALQFTTTTVSFDAGMFDTLLRSQGVKFVHWRAMRCPVGMVDRYDVRRPHEDHSGCSNGHLYTKAGTVTCIFTGNTNDSRQNDIGLLDGSVVQVTSPRCYDSSDEEVQVVPYDRFYLLEEAITVPHIQLVEAHVTGRDKLSFPVVKVIDVVDSSGKRYGVGDYEIEGGQLVWKSGGPGYDPVAKRGVTYSIRYSYRPYWYVMRVLHEVRVAQIETALKREVMRMPQQFMLQREYIGEKSENDEMAVTDEPDIRQEKGPRTGAFGPR